ncbi:hypothetical protein ISCGN_019632 [Ixodes scapularis]
MRGRTSDRTVSSYMCFAALNWLNGASLSDEGDEGSDGETIPLSVQIALVRERMKDIELQVRLAELRAEERRARARLLEEHHEESQITAVEGAEPEAHCVRETERDARGDPETAMEPEADCALQKPESAMGSEDDRAVQELDTSMGSKAGSVVHEPDTAVGSEGNRGVQGPDTDVKSEVDRAVQEPDTTVRFEADQDARRRGFSSVRAARREELPENQGSGPARGRLANAEVARGAAAVAHIAQIGLRCPHDRPSGDGVTRQVPPGGRRGEVLVQAHESPWSDHLGAGKEIARQGSQGRKAGSSLDQVVRRASAKHSSVGRPSRARLRGPRGSCGEHHHPRGTRHSCSSMGR